MQENVLQGSHVISERPGDSGVVPPLLWTSLPVLFRFVVWVKENLRFTNRLPGAEAKRWASPKAFSLSSATNLLEEVICAN